MQRWAGKHTAGKEKKTVSRMPNVYHPLWGTPFYWGDEQSGELVVAIVAYLNHMLTQAPFSGEQCVLVADYLRYYIDAPCWQGPDLPQLRQQARTLDSAQTIAAWIERCLDSGLDPL